MRRATYTGKMFFFLLYGDETWARDLFIASRRADDIKKQTCETKRVLSRPLTRMTRVRYFSRQVA